MSSTLLSKSEMTRYQRQMILPEIGVLGQEKLKRATVLVVGVGALGCPALTYFASAGVGTIKIADSDLVDLTNLHRQPLFIESAVGRPKVEEAARVLTEKNSSVNIISINCRVDCKNIREILSEVDLVIDGSDNFSTKYLLNDACVELEKTLISGAVFTYEGHVSVFNAPNSDGSRGPTYRCIFPEPPSPSLVPSCAEAGVLGVIPGIIGTIQASEALKIILGFGEILSGRLLIFDALKMSFSDVSFERMHDVVLHTKIQSSSYYQNLMVPCSLNISKISPSELKRKLKLKEDILLIDVRESFEKSEFDIGGELIPSGVLKANVHRIPRDRTVVMYCRSGVRSKKGIEELTREFGFTNLLNLEGGILAWQDEADGF